MEYVVIMGMTFESGSEPDFGSIIRSKERHDGVHDYALNAEDVELLDNITNAAPGSTALCVDTGDIYILMSTGWVKVGGDSGTASANAASAQSVNLTPQTLQLGDVAVLDVMPDDDLEDV